MRELQRSFSCLKGMLPRFFWGGMLLGHFPLIVRSMYCLSVGDEVLQSGKSLLTLLVASGFFLFKLRGGRLLKTRPTFYQIVAFCLLGVFLHLFLFPPSVMENPYEFFLLKCLVATATVLALTLFAHLIRKPRVLRLSSFDSNRLFLLFRRYRIDLPLPFVEVFLAIPSSGVIRRGPPIASLQG